MGIGSNSRLSITNLKQGTYGHELIADVAKGLTAPQPSIPSRYFYDGRGSALFEQICRLPEYYQTRCELSVLRRSAAAIMADFAEGALVELGSGANWKVRVLLDAALKNGRASALTYVPVDVSQEALLSACRELLDIYPTLSVHGIIGDFAAPIDGAVDGARKLITFFGSTVGNLDERERNRLLRGIAASMTEGDRLLLGIDLVKPVDVLERAYNDSAGVTAAFNGNILNVVNREARTDLDPGAFAHRAFFNYEGSRIEMHLQANRDIHARIGAAGSRVEIAQHQTIRTEICVKFTRASAEEMASEAGFRISRWFTDSRGWFAVIELVPA